MPRHSSVAHRSAFGFWRQRPSPKTRKRSKTEPRMSSDTNISLPGASEYASKVAMFGCLNRNNTVASL